MSENTNQRSGQCHANGKYQIIHPGVDWTLLYGDGSNLGRQKHVDISFQAFFHLGERTIYNSAFQELLGGLQIEVVHCPLTAPVICKSSKKGGIAHRQILVCSV